jgi:pyrimidine operon attenuation protein/uracil phosphoribosyltransferase
MRNQYDDADVRRIFAALVDRIAAAISPNLPLHVVGVRTRGEILAQRLVEALKSRGYANISRGVLDITLYRDDLSEIGIKPLVRPTDIQGDISGHVLLLVDDVIFTGRSIRAALDLLSDFGRPSAVRLAVLVDRGGRELPIQADFVGLTLSDIPKDHRVNVKMAEVDGHDEILVEPRNLH